MRWRETEGEAHACVRYPPTVTILALPEQDRLSGEMRMSMQRLTAYPALELDNRCGEWKSRLPEQVRLNIPPNIDPNDVEVLNLDMVGQMVGLGDDQ